MADEGSKKPRVKKKKSPAKQAEVPDPQENIIDNNSIKKSTKATFDLYLEQAQANVARDKKTSPKKPKSRRKKEGEEVLLENLRNSSEFQKDKDEETKKRNTYDPDDTKEKSNKRRDRTARRSAGKSARPPRAHSAHSGADNPAYEEEGRDRLTSPDRSDGDRPLTIEELDSNTKKGKSVKKGRKKAKKQEEETEAFIEDNEILPPEDTKKKAKNKKSKGKADSTEPADTPTDTADYVAYTDEDKIAGVIIHRADKLRTNFLLQHPLVRIHIIDSETGQYVIKQDRDRPVTSYYETQKRDETPDSILPMMTQAFNFKEMRTIIPWWDEMLVFNENFNYLVQENPKVIVFFELLDFVSMNRASRNQNNRSYVKGEEGWHKEAWAFLKLRGGNGKLNVDKQVRLQLFEIPRVRMTTDEVPVYQYWKYCVRRTYPSSLYVTVRSVLPPDTVEPAVRSMFPTQEERGTMTMKQIQEALSKTHTKAVDDTPAFNWSRLPGQMCKLPNSMLLSLPAAKMGCLVMSFSNDGRFLACGCNDKSSNPILIYSIPDGELVATLNGHYNNVYEISWSKSDVYLLSASSDGTARVWNVENQKCYKMLPHPTFVYCAQFHPRVSKVIVTGSYDNTVRIWHIDGNEIHANLQQELDGHDTYINSVCFDEEGTKLYTADNLGIIKIWNVYVTEKASKKGVTRDWQLNTTVDLDELKDLSISHMKLHPSGRRLIVHTKDNTIRMLDLRMMSITQRYVGALNFREMVHSDISPCGTFVFSGSEDGCAYVWNTDTGDQVAVYSELNFTQAVNDVKFHPLDHIVAFCSRGDNHKVQIFKYEYNLAEKEAKSYFSLLAKSPGDRDENLPSPTEETPREDMSLQIETKKHRAMRKLESVMEFNRSANRQNQRHPDPNSTMMPATAPPGVVSGGEGNMTMNTWSSTGDWGSTFDRSYSRTAASAGIGPTIMSPHARQTGETEAMRSHLTSQMDYMKKSSNAGWRPGFTPVGGRVDRAPSMSMSMPSETNPSGNFTLQGADDMKPIGEVIALYDYRAQRSDELSFRKNDVISVFYKDTEHWWMGMLKTTSAQGFLPSNYVESADGGNLDEYKTGQESIKAKKSTTSAVVDKEGKLRFLSGTESDASSVDLLDGDRPKKRRSRATLGDRRSRSRERRRNRVSDESNLVPSFEHLLD